MSEFTHLIDLASSRLGGEAVATNDDFFAPKDNLLKPEPPIFIPDKYTDRGKWMDGWESRRRRTPGHDWCIVKLGLPGIIHSFVVDTAFFKGNYPSHCSIDGCGLPPGADPTRDDVTWHPVLERSELAGDSKNAFSIKDPRRFTHLRLNIFPDGGVARLHVMGEVLPDWTRILAAGAEIDLVAAVNGGYVVDVSDRFFGDARNMLMPYPAPNMGDGWETKRRRGPGHDWAIVRLGMQGAIRRVELSTAHYKGNYPDSASIEATVVKDESRGVSADVSTRATAGWTGVLPQTKLQPDHLHAFADELGAGVHASHVRLNIFPDGGVSRFRVYGIPLPDARRQAVVRQLNAMDAPELRAAFADFCAAPAWIDRMTASRPFASAEAILAAADEAAKGVPDADWLEAFRHHPRIGERQAERIQSEAARGMSASEQGGVERAAAADVAALAEGNRAYEARFGYVFIVSAAGRTVPEMLAMLKERLGHDPAAELRVAAAEQQKITRLRLARLFG
ncbi:MAG TPA: allantoicase [Vicinamibacterales bacterium]|nr:allantoicase [Vicinamibacterales bacterium]